MDRKALSLVALVVVLSVTLWGCAAVAGAAAGAGTYAWTQGKLTFSTANSVSATHDATLAALNQLGITVTSDEMDRLGGTIKAVSDTGDDITIDLKPRGADVTEIHIRVGFFGDRGKSEKIADTIRRNLG